jgi:HAD superfamily hydrolase (TIGR01490 family)
MHSNKEIIIIDFDETLYKKDSLIEFCKFIYRKKPLQIWAILPQLIGSILFLLKIIDTKKYKELFLMFLYGINENEVEILAKEFWDGTGMENFNANITALFNRKEYRIICISASPEIYLKPILSVYQIELIGTLLQFKQNKYKILGENCKGIEKVNRLSKYLNTSELEIAESYSDSLTDLPLFKISKKSFLIDEDGKPYSYQSS